SYYYSHFVLRVGDCAAEILGQIAGRSFYTRRSTSGAMLKDGDALEVRRRAEAWWAEFQRDGERQSLVAGVAAGDDNSHTQADRLGDRYPADALAAIRTGVGRAMPHVRIALVLQAARLSGPEVDEFLRAEMAGPTLDLRVTAATRLLERGYGDVVEAMRAEWQRLDPRENYPEGGGALAEFLIRWSGRREAIDDVI